MFAKLYIEAFPVGIGLPFCADGVFRFEIAQAFPEQYSDDRLPGQLADSA